MPEPAERLRGILTDLVEGGADLLDVAHRFHTDPCTALRMVKETAPGLKPALLANNPQDRAEPAPPRIPEQRGESAYVNRGARDTYSTAAAARGRARRREERRWRLEADPTLRPHGTWNTYSEWGCRCEDCLVAGREHNQHYRDAR